MTLSIKPVTPAHVHQIWNSIERFIADALKWGGDDYTIDQAKVFLASGEWLLVVAVDEENKIHGAGAIKFTNMPNSRIAFIVAIGGKLVVNKTSLEQLKAIVQQMGATKIQAAVRPSVEKLLRQTNFYKRYTIVETKI